MPIKYKNKLSSQKMNYNNNLTMQEDKLSDLHLECGSKLNGLPLKPQKSNQLKHVCGDQLK